MKSAVTYELYIGEDLEGIFTSKSELRGYLDLGADEEDLIKNLINDDYKKVPPKYKDYAIFYTNADAELDESEPLKIDEMMQLANLSIKNGLTYNYSYENNKLRAKSAK